MTLDTKRLRSIASGSTPGEWQSRTEIGHPGVVAVVQPGAFDWICSMQVSNSPRFRENAAHIAAFCPATAIALLDRIEQLEGAFAKVDAADRVFRDELRAEEGDWTENVGDLSDALCSAIDDCRRAAAGIGEG